MDRAPTPCYCSANADAESATDTNTHAHTSITVISISWRMRGWTFAVLNVEHVNSWHLLVTPNNVYNLRRMDVRWATSLRHNQLAVLLYCLVRSTRHEVHPKPIILIFVVHITSAFQCAAIYIPNVCHSIENKSDSLRCEIVRLDGFQNWALT